MKPMFIVALGFVMSTAAHAQPFEAAGAIDRAVEQVLGIRIGEAGGAAYPVDPRLKLARCPASLTVRRAGSAAVEVSCIGVGWRVRVPLAIAHHSAYPDAPAIKRGDTVSVSLRGAGFEITTSGVALDNAAAGAGVRVKSLTDGSVFQAIVIGGGIVELRD